MLQNEWFDSCWCQGLGGVPADSTSYKLNKDNQNDTVHSIHDNIKTYQNHHETIIDIEENKETTANSRDQEGFRRFLEARTLDSWKNTTGPRRHRRRGLKGKMPGNIRWYQMILEKAGSWIQVNESLNVKVMSLWNASREMLRFFTQLFFTDTAHAQNVKRDAAVSRRQFSGRTGLSLKSRAGLSSNKEEPMPNFLLACNEGFVMAKQCHKAQNQLDYSRFNYSNYT